ncbi:MAG: membrane protein [Desulfobulbaceae bacterium BRH_c16a]|nr:MAG: membrane protein [Desulfobulbaceae bacterium BRH_c16a]
MSSIYEKITYAFDPLHHRWEHEKMHRKISIALVLFFLLSLVCIELNRQNLLPGPLESFIPRNHFFAVHAAFTVVLILEVISLVFTIPCSFSRSVGKQFEILSLILMRNAFKELSDFPEPITFTGNEQAVLHILSDGFGALLIFAALGCYYLVQARTASDEKMQPTDLYSFVAAKKGIALVLLLVFIFMGLHSAVATVMGIPHPDVLHGFYTILILTDILIVLISQCFQPSFYAVFRNSGYALSTLIIRLALAAPPFFNVLLGLAAALIAISLTYVSRTLFAKKTTTK